LAVVLTLAIHLLLAGILLFGWESMAKPVPPKKMPQYVQAVLVEHSPQAEGKSRPQPTPTPKATPVSQATPTPRATPIPKPTVKPEPTPRPKPTATPAPTRRPTPVATPKPSPTKKPTPVPTKKPTLHPTLTPTPAPPREPSFDELLAQEAEELERREQQALARARQQELDQARRQEKLAAAQAEINLYSQLIRQTVERNWIKPPKWEPGMQVVIEIRLMPGGELLEAAIIKSSGNPAFDRSAMMAITKAGQFSVPADLELFDAQFRRFRFVFDPGFE
jgi:colicin import membrane protein